MRHFSEMVQSNRAFPGLLREQYKPPAKDSPFRTAGRRTLHFTGTMTLRDSEWPGADEIMTLDLGSHFAGVDIGHRKVMYFEGRCGGEVRLEMDVFASLGVYDSIIVNLDVRLYEGASATSSDLDGRGNFTIHIPATPGDNKRSISATVWNTDEDEIDDQGFFLVFLANEA